LVELHLPCRRGSSAALEPLGLWGRCDSRWTASSLAPPCAGRLSRPTLSAVTRLGDRTVAAWQPSGELRCTSSGTSVITATSSVLIVSTSYRWLQESGEQVPWRRSVRPFARQIGRCHAPR